MDRPYKILTIIAFIIEIIGAFLVSNSAFAFSTSFSDTDVFNLFDGHPEDFHMMAYLYAGLGVFLVLMLMVNFYMFSKLFTGKYSIEKARAIYIFQIIWGSINILLVAFTLVSIITGLLYIISGVQGSNSISLNKEAKFEIWK